MSYVTSKQPVGTPTWIDLGVPDLERAMEFYGAVFGWDFEVGPPETMRYTICRMDGRAVAALADADGSSDSYWWTVYFATDDSEDAARKIEEAGGKVLAGPMDIGTQGRVVLAKDAVGAQFGTWETKTFVGCEVVNEPGALLRNDMATPTPGPARAFYDAVFGLTSEGNPDFPDGYDFTFLRRPDGNEIGGIMGVPGTTSSAWGVLFEVADTDATVAKIRAAGGTSEEPYDMVYGRIADVRDPFGAEFSIGSRASGPA